MRRVISDSMGLLETLSMKVGCMYLSDLHDPELLPLIQYHLRWIARSVTPYGSGRTRQNI